MTQHTHRKLAVLPPQRLSNHADRSRRSPLQRVFVVAHRVVPSARRETAGAERAVLGGRAAAAGRGAAPQRPLHPGRASRQLVCRLHLGEHPRQGGPAAGERTGACDELSRGGLRGAVGESQPRQR